MATSSVPGAKAALIASLQARPALVGVQVAWGEPQNSARARELIVVGAIQNFRETSATTGQWRDESYTLPVYVQVVQEGGADHSACSQRAYAMLAEVEEQVRGGAAGNGTGDPTLTDGAATASGAYIRWALVTGLRENEGYDGQSRYTRLDTEINVMARI